MPEMALNSVVLPAPLGPTIGDELPVADLDRHAVERGAGRRSAR